jgi:hypothetical protein
MKRIFFFFYMITDYVFSLESERPRFHPNQSNEAAYYVNHRESPSDLDSKANFPHILGTFDLKHLATI